MLNYNELKDLLDQIYDKLTEEITMANRSGEEELEKVLDKYGFNDKKEEYLFCDVRSSKILVLGNTQLSVNELNGIAKSIGIDPDRIDYELDYNRITNFNVENLRYNTKYSDILVGPVPHKAKGIDGSSSLITHIEKNQEEFPKLIRVTDSNGLKITKTSFREALSSTRLFNELINA